ncbi:chymotrypsin inhibitor-like [Cotesia glomerata]|uniref:chymotrypsin inhibitor-like n=1 Tax=Cotesia glomerata TaxID=32391 RepID=UPI001D026B4E|nr:chymotrypsin inhibitor-like [Cotesia glomerata]
MTRRLIYLLFVFLAITYVNCAKGCSKHEEMNNCGSLCEPSCSNQFPDCGSGPSVPPSCGPRPMRGCRCQSGFFRKDNGKCSKKC